MYTVTVTQILNKLGLENLTPDIDTDHIQISQTDINRPALQLADFFDHFDADRVQVMGNVEYAYLSKFTKEDRLNIMTKLFDNMIPCLIYCRNLEPDEELVSIAVEKGVALLRSQMTTCEFMAEIIRWLKIELAPRITIHGVLVDVYGEGVMIMGESGIGKSEAALELIKRGHRLVTDDVVQIKKISDETLVGSAPEVTKHFIELRGIGIINVKTMFGVSAVKDTQEINLVIKLEEWDREKAYDRLGLEEEYIELLGTKICCHSIPIRPGRNLAVIVESAAVNYRQKQMGYHAAQELYKKVTGNFEKKKAKNKENKEE